MAKLSAGLARRRQIHDRYSAELASVEWLTLPPAIPSDCESSYYFYWLQLKDRTALAKYLLDQGVYTTFRYWPLHKVDYFKEKSAVGHLPESDFACEHTLNIPIHPSLTDDDVTKIITLIRSFRPSV
jgi:aminotransferase